MYIRAASLAESFVYLQYKRLFFWILSIALWAFDHFLKTYKPESFLMTVMDGICIIFAHKSLVVTGNLRMFLLAIIFRTSSLNDYWSDGSTQHRFKYSLFRGSAKCLE